jgi:uncharacterized protein (DUF952 family)
LKTAGKGETGKMAKTIYKIVPASLWQNAKDAGIFEGAAIDLADGYIHFSTAPQAKETAARHFAGQKDLLLVAVDGDALGDRLVYEPSRGGDLFPHLYAPLEFSTVDFVVPLPLGPGGAHQFPDLETGR